MVTRALAILALLLPTVAHAQPPEQARALFLEGLERVDQERWGEAAQLFERSWALVERPSTAYNLAMTRLRLNQPTAALDALNDYLRIAEGPREEARRARAREMLETALADVAHVTLTVSPTTAVVRVDGEMAAGDGAIRELRLDPGEHALRVEAEGHEPTSLELSVLAGERSRQDVRLTRLPSPEGPARLRVTSDRPTARVLVDGEEVGLGTYVTELPPGPHRVEVREDGFVAFRRSFELAPGERRDLQASLAPASPELTEEPLFWILTVSGAALIAGGIILGVVLGTQMGDAYGGNTDVVLQGLRVGF